MSLSNFSTGPDGKLSYSALIEAMEKVNTLANLTAENFSPITINWNGTGFVVSDNRIPGRWIKITSGTQPYAWTAQVDDGSGTLSADDDTGASGTTTVIPAYEINGKANVAANSIVWAWPSIDGLSMLFDVSTMTISPQTFSNSVTFSGSTVAFNNTTTTFTNPVTLLQQTTQVAAPASGYVKLYATDHDIAVVSATTRCCIPCAPSTGVLDDGTQQYYWKMEEAAGNNREDTLNNVDLTENRYDGGPASIGSGTGIAGTTAADLILGDYLATASTVDLGTDDWSVTGWIRPETNLDPGGTGVSQMIGISGQQAGFQLNTSGTDTFLMTVDSQTATSTITPALDTWFMFYIQYDASTKKAGISINAETLVESSAFGGTHTVSASAIVIGSGTGTTAGLVGKIDEVIVRKGTGSHLSASQLTSLYNSGNGTAKPGCGTIPSYYLPGGSAGDHTALSNLGITASGHTGTATRLWGANGAGAAAEYTITGTGTVIVAATSPTLVTPDIGTPSAGTLTNCTGLPIASGVSGLGASVATFLATPSSANLAAAVTGETGTGALVFATSPGFTTAANPVSDDGAALGTTALGWSDLHLATGALVNVANGNWVATHSSGILTVSTGDLRVTTAGTNTASVVTVGGTQTLTNKTLTSPVLTTPALGTPASGTLTSCTGFDCELLDSEVASGAVTVELTTGFSSTYTHYLLTMANVVPANDGVDIWLRTSTDGGSSFDSGASDYGWANNVINAASGTNTTQSDAADDSIHIATNQGNGANEKGGGQLLIMNPAATEYTFVSIDYTCFNSTPDLVTRKGGGVRLTAANVDAIQIMASAGNISGTFKLYGLRAA